MRIFKSSPIPEITEGPQLAKEAVETGAPGYFWKCDHEHMIIPAPERPDSLLENESFCFPTNISSEKNAK